MADYNILKNSIQQVIKTNGNNEITGEILQQTLLAMIDSLGAGYLFMGVAETNTNPGTPDQNVFYISSVGTFTHFGVPVTIPEGYIGIFLYDGSWDIKQLQVGKNYDTIISSIVETLNTKANKVSGAIAGDFAGLDGNGNLIDSGKKDSDFATALQGAKADTAYQKPSEGIPGSDIENGTITEYKLNSTLKSKIDNTVNLTGDQVIEGYKKFTDGIETESIFGDSLTITSDGDSDFVAHGTMRVDAEEKIRVSSGRVELNLNGQLNIEASDTYFNEDVEVDGNMEVIGNIHAANKVYSGNKELAKKEYVDTGLATKQDTLTFDTIPTANSTNPVTSGGVKTYVDSHVPIMDDVPTQGSNNPVKSGGIYDAIENAAFLGADDGQAVIPDFDAQSEVEALKNDVSHLEELYEALTQSDIVVVESSDWPLSDLEENTIYRVQGTTSYADYMYDGTNAIKMAEYNNAIDATPTANSGNLVTSGGVFEKISDASCPYNEALGSLGSWFLPFNGTSSKINLVTPIVLSQDGDSLEFKLSSMNNASLAGGGYGFATRSSGVGLSIGVISTSVYVRASDNTWLLQNQSLGNRKTIKIEYAGGNIKFYFDGTLISTYTGQKEITIDTFGYSASYGYWNGGIEWLKVNGVNKDLTFGSTVTNTSYSRINAFLTDEQASILNSLRSPMFVSKSAARLDVYMKTPKGNFIYYPLNYRQKNYTIGQYPSFYDNWGIGQVWEATYNGVSMTFSSPLFQGGEAELAVSVPSGDDNVTPTYVGGSAHGFENIVNSVTYGREISILVDNMLVAESDTLSLTSAQKVEVIQHSQLCQAYTDSNPFADVVKHWIWEDGKMSCTTTLKVLRSLEFSFAQFGMMCVYRHWGGNVNNDYLTNRAIKNNLPFKVWDISDGWSGALQTPDEDCTRIVEYGQMGYGFSMSIKTNTLQINGGMFVATNGLAYNKIYFDMGRGFTPSVDDVLEATQIWEIY